MQILIEDRYDSPAAYGRTADGMSDGGQMTTALDEFARFISGKLGRNADMQSLVVAEDAGTVTLTAFNGLGIASRCYRILGDTEGWMIEVLDKFDALMRTRSA